jgi:hypothetical protein
MMEAAYTVAEITGPLRRVGYHLARRGRLRGELRRRLSRARHPRDFARRRHHRAARSACPHDRGVRPPLRPRRPAPGTDRRTRRPVTAESRRDCCCQTTKDDRHATRHEPRIPRPARHSAIPIPVTSRSPGSPEVSICAAESAALVLGRVIQNRNSCVYGSRRRGCDKQRGRAQLCWFGCR